MTDKTTNDENASRLERRLTLSGVRERYAATGTLTVHDVSFLLTIAVDDYDLSADDIARNVEKLLTDDHFPESIRGAAVAAVQEVDLTVDALRAALKAAVDEIVDHNHEYKHRTPAGELESWRKLAAGDPETETRARLVALGKLCRPPASSVRAAVGTLDAARHVFVDLPRWEDDGGAS